MEKNSLGTEYSIECEKGETKNLVNYFFEYGSDTKRGGDAFVTL